MLTLIAENANDCMFVCQFFAEKVHLTKETLLSIKRLIASHIKTLYSQNCEDFSMATYILNI